MVFYCICGGCNNSSKSGHRVHCFPKDKGILRSWVQFVKFRRADFSASSVTAYSRICSAHFKEEDYHSGDAKMVSLGLKSKRTAKLIPTAVPSVHANHSACPVPRSRDTVCRKREIATMLTDASQQETVASVDTVESVDTGDQPLPSSTSDAGTQCFLKPPRWSHAVQVNLKPKMVSVGTQTSISPQTSTPLASPEQTVDDDDDDNATVISDLSWVPEEPMDEEELFDEEPPYTCDPHHNCIDKFIVCQEELMGLFAICPACCERSDSSIVQQEGTFVKIKQVCASCGYHRFWQNQPMLHRNMPTCNLLLSGAIHFTGCLATQTLRMLTLFGLQCISASSFFRHQRRYTIPVIVQAWQNDQAKNFSDLRAMDGGLVLAGDCRSDSPGHCAKYGSYSLIEDRENKVVDVQLVQSSEVPNSSWCELEGLKRSVGLLRGNDLHLATLITDRHRQVAKWVREELIPEGTQHYFDVWHIAKSLGKALDAASKECDQLQLWRPAIVNHLYWTAASTPDGNPAVMEAKWRSLVNHIQDIHDHDTPAFSSCAHGPLDEDQRNKEWLDPVMTSSADQEVKQNLISTVGGEVTIPEPVKSHGFLVKQGVIIAGVKDSVLEVVNDDFLNRTAWDRATGLFTLRRLKSNDSGDYAVNVIVTFVSFKLSVYDAVLEPGVNVTSVSSVGCTLLCAVDQLSGGTLSWYQGEVLVNQSSTQRSLPLTVDRLGLRSSYRCVSANPAGNLTRSVDPKTSCPVEQRTGDEDEEESNRLLRILIPIFPVAVVISVCVIVFFVVKRRKRATHLQASILSVQDVTPKEEAVQENTLYDLLQAPRIVNPTAAART